MVFRDGQILLTSLQQKTCLRGKKQPGKIMLIAGQFDRLPALMKPLSDPCIQKPMHTTAAIPQTASHLLRLVVAFQS